jgi:hypothetical protein
MFAKLNNRITRSILAATIPALATLGLANSAKADWDNPQPAPFVQPGNSLSYTGESDGLSVTMTIDYNSVDGDTVRGTMSIDGVDYPFIMQLVNNDFEGIVIAPDRQIPFTGTSQGNTVYLDILDTHVMLQPGT